MKWLNDLIVDGKCKLVGLFVEGGGEYVGLVCVVIGIGINIYMLLLFGE